MSIAASARRIVGRAVRGVASVRPRPKPSAPQFFHLSNTAERTRQRAPFVFTSGLCREAHFRMPLYEYWCMQLGEEPRYHRKQWEHVYICQVLHERGALFRGARGVGFGVGREPLASLFASRGIDVVATDMDADAAVEAGWAATDQHAGSQLAGLNARGLCESAAFALHARYRTVDMNAIPADLRGFDFCWSSCSYEHLGSIERGNAFVRRSLDVLRAGGIAVHTTEYNLSSDSATVASGPTVLFRQRDFRELAATLRNDGHQVLPFDFTIGSEPAERYVDVPPYTLEPHLRLRLQFGLRSYATTSIGVIVIKGDEGGE
jgi:hypothetical protein